MSADLATAIATLNRITRTRAPGGGATHRPSWSTPLMTCCAHGERRNDDNANDVQV